MGLANLLDRFLGRQAPETSKNAAKDRLKLVLMHDRSDIPATMMEAIRAEMIQVLSKYVEIDTEALEVQLEREQGAIGLVLNIPIRRVKSEAEAADALAAMHAFQTGKAISADLRERQAASAVEEKVEVPASKNGAVKDGPEIAAVDLTRDPDDLSWKPGDLPRSPVDFPNDIRDIPRHTGDLKAGGTGDLAAERAEPND